MGLFRRFLSTVRAEAAQETDHRAAKQSEIEVELFDGSHTLEIVGESHYQDALWQIVGGWREERVRQEAITIIAAEWDNPYDDNAISAWINGLHVGYLSREDAARYRPGLLALEARHERPIALNATIAGGGARADGPGRLGVFLSHDPVDFGLPVDTGSPYRRVGSPRTGFSDAAATDEHDESYDLSWIGRIPDDPIAAIAALRRLLTEEQDLIDRHFMFLHLERLLYKSRDAFTSALDEYDGACRAHDAEMEGIRDALLAKWGSVPVLETYRQMAIRQQKAREYEQALWWAERGLSLYAGDALRPEAVDDLLKRVDEYRNKLGGPNRDFGVRSISQET